MCIVLISALSFSELFKLQELHWNLKSSDNSIGKNLSFVLSTLRKHGSLNFYHLCNVI